MCKAKLNLYITVFYEDVYVVVRGMRCNVHNIWMFEVNKVSKHNITLCYSISLKFSVNNGHMSS